MATGELYPVDCVDRLCDRVKTGDVVELDLDQNTIKLVTTGQVLATKPLGDAKPVIDAGGIFNYARATGMIKTTRPQD